MSPQQNSSTAALLAAIRSGSLQDLKAALAQGADPTEPQVLLQALRGDADRRQALPLPVLQALIGAGMRIDRVNIGGRDPHWVSPLEEALSEPFRAALFLPLLAAGAPLNVTGMLQALVRQPFSEYGRHAEQALAQGLSVDSRHFEFSDTALHIAAWRGDLAWLDFLLARGASLELVNRNLETPLGSAVRADSVPAAQRLLAAGANPNSRLDHSTLLDWSSDHRAMHRLLAQAGAQSERPAKRLGKLDRLWDACHEAEGPEQQVEAFGAFLRAADVEPAWIDLAGALTRARDCQDARWGMLELTEALLPTRTTAIDRDPDGLSADFYRDLVQELAGLGGTAVDKLQCKAGPQGYVLSFEALGQAQRWPLNPAHEGFDSGFWVEADALLKAHDKNLRYWRMEFDSVELVCCVPRKVAKLWEADPIR
ncbi:MAG: ankyrin repeat domain-containing protein [Inhella sp.]